jgi:hypothetical protein
LELEFGPENVFYFKFNFIFLDRSKDI